MGNVNWIKDRIKERNATRRASAATADAPHQVAPPTVSRKQTRVRTIAMSEDEGPSPAKRVELSDERPEGSSPGQPLQRAVMPLSQCSSMVSNVTHGGELSETDFFGSGEDSDYDPGHPMPPVTESRKKRFMVEHRQLTAVLSSDPDI